MRLLTRKQGGSWVLTKDLTEPYAILSHTWGVDEDEVTFDDIKSSTNMDKAGAVKLSFCASQALKDGLKYSWIDTCCIDRANHVELSEAITSMFRWYRQSTKCYVYLPDVSAEGDDSEHAIFRWEAGFRNSRWWTRGWTLQELLAPASVEFFSREGKRLGSKATLKRLINDITGIPVAALEGTPLTQFSIEERLRWTNGRQTRKIEDRAYCLLGIFDVSMSLRYGRGEKELTRLQAKVAGLSKHTAPHELIEWLAPSRSQELHAKASISRHPGTGVIFCEGPLMTWVGAGISHGSLMWIRGKSGSGKTTLFSHIVEAIQTFVSGRPTAAFAYHYCTFVDDESQKLINILGSLVAQISIQYPAILNDVEGIFSRDQKRKQDKSLHVWELEQIIIKHLGNCTPIVFLIDALNECREYLDIEACLFRLLRQLTGLRVLVTSTRPVPTSESTTAFQVVGFSMRPDHDIYIYVQDRLSHHPVLRHLSFECKESVRSALTKNADQSFRWAALMLDNLCKQRTGKEVLKALAKMPDDLNSTYSKMLNAIPRADRQLAREALLWASFALRPLTLLELSEAAVVEETDTTIDQDSRLFRPAIILEICQGFLDHDVVTGRVKLAHSSIKTYLLSDLVKSSVDSFFSLNFEEGNQTILRKCLTYLLFTDFATGVARTQPDLDDRERRFPLLTYAARFWGHHTAFATENDWVLTRRLYATRHLPRGGNYGAWSSCLRPEYNAYEAVDTSPLYHAASLGIKPLLQALLSDPSLQSDLERPGGRYGSTPLQAACFHGQRETAEALVVAGADFWTEDPGSDEPPWFWAQSNRWSDLVQRMVQLKPEIAESVEARLHEAESASLDDRRWDYEPLTRLCD